MTEQQQGFRWHLLLKCRASQVAQRIKNLHTTRETWVPSPGWEDRLEKGMATHSSVLARISPWTEKPGGLQSIGSKRVKT